MSARKQCHSMSWFVAIAAAVLTQVSACGVAGQIEHRDGVLLSKFLKLRVCNAAVVDWTEPCGKRDVRYEASPRKVTLNVYGVDQQSEITSLVASLRQQMATSNINVVVKVRFLGELGVHKLIHSETLEK